MIRLIEVLNYRCLRYIRQPLAPFHILVGPNASGKTTFLDVVSFVGRLVSEGLDAALEERTANFEDLVWNRGGNFFEIAIEAAIPSEICQQFRDKKWDTIRYEVQIGIDQETQAVSILDESVLLKVWQEGKRGLRSLFPIEPSPPESLMTRRVKGARRVVRKALSGVDHFYTESAEKSGKGWFPSIRLGPRRSAFGNLPEDREKFPATTWFRGLLTTGIQMIALNSLLMRRPSPPGRGRKFNPDGSNLPWIIAELRDKDLERFDRWRQHVQTALPDLEAIHTKVRPEDRHRYLVVQYQGGVEVPSWMISDGTLRLLALTILAYLPELRGVYLIEEPENGIHPRAVETVYQSLSSVYDAQVLLATHSPVILNLAQPEDVLCFTKAPSGATDIVLGKDHPYLQHWKNETTLGALLASGVLG
ncbi:MAG: methylation-associated defense system AAA family ATPase MAD3 [Thermogutta sp.]